MRLVVDVNVHVVAPRDQWSRYPIVPIPGFAGEFTDDQITTAAYLASLMDWADVDRAVLIGSRFHGFDNSYCADGVAELPGRFIGIANIDVYDQRAADQAEYWVRERGMSGLRFWGRGRNPATWLADETHAALWRKVRQLGVPCNAQTTSPAAFAAAKAFLADFTDAGFTVNNLGQVKPGADAAVTAELLGFSRYENVYVSMSVDFLAETLVGGSAARELFEELLEHFGAGKLMWSAFYPSVQNRTYVESVDVVRAALADLTPTEQQGILGGAACSLYPSPSEKEQMP